MEPNDGIFYDLRPLAELLSTSGSTAEAAAAALTTRGNPITITVTLSRPADCDPSDDATESVQSGRPI